MRNRELVAGAFVVLAALAAQAEGVAMKPGLWERTVTMQMPGAPAMPDLPELDQLPPEQRAQIEQSLGAMSGKPVTTRECVTPEMLKRWEDFSKGESESSCTHEVREQTPQRVSMSLSCDRGQTTGTMDFAAPTPERMTGNVTMRSRRNGAEHTMKMQLASRWLGADCGAVKPREMPPASRR